MTAPDPPLPQLPLPSEITETYLPSNVLKYHLLQAGQRGNPLLLCLHGFPELVFSWRKIMPAISKLGYYVVAYDQRGYGRTTGWDTGDFSSVDLNTFTFTRLVRDAIILVNALGYREVACVIGHDFGAVVASMCALMRPDMFRSLPNTPKEDVHTSLARLRTPRKHYKWYVSTGPAAPEMLYPKSDMPTFLRQYFYVKSASDKRNNPRPLSTWSASELEKLPYYYVMPQEASMREAVQTITQDMSLMSIEPWLPEKDLLVYAEEFKRTGFQGGLNWYRIATDPQKWMKDIELFAGKKIEVPTMFVAGEKDWGTYQEPGVLENLIKVYTQFRGTRFVKGAGHWVQQEQPASVVNIVREFLGGSWVRSSLFDDGEDGSETLIHDGTIVIF